MNKGIVSDWDFEKTCMACNTGEMHWEGELYVCKKCGWVDVYSSAIGEQPTVPTAKRGSDQEELDEEEYYEELEKRLK